MKAPPTLSPTLSPTSSSAPPAPTAAELAREFAGTLAADVLMPDKEGRELTKGRRVRLVIESSRRQDRIGRVERIESHEGRLRALIVKRNILGQIVWSAWVGSAEVEMTESAPLVLKPSWTRPTPQHNPDNLEPIGSNCEHEPNSMDATGVLLRNPAPLTRTTPGNFGRTSVFLKSEPVAGMPSEFLTAPDHNPAQSDPIRPFESAPVRDTRSVPGNFGRTSVFLTGAPVAGGVK